ncbi:uncharacterized protein LOC106710969 [Papilio machaon]|uniref:uncharacterized protein LOC106710969 n=1 Tax=Papilio machaon TaxID=76193 RepID=UPI001E664EB5|nr:uncharacterized protein LOC106710969 [Papilio machaon]
MQEVYSKLSPFLAERPALWFAKAEAVFYVSGITDDETKYNCVISHIDASEAKDLATHTPTKGSRYEWIKEEILQRFSRSEARMRQIFDDELGDRRPSQFLRTLKCLLGKDSVDDAFLRQLWLRRLPIDVQAILQTQWDLPIDKIAEIADKIMDVKSISVKSQTPSPEFSNLEKQIAELTSQVAALNAQYEYKRNPRNRSQSRSQSRNRYNSTICYYHWKFGRDAKKCTKPCSWK